MLELYNTTNITRRIPRFNYRGTFVLRPHEAVTILDDQASFFKPYAAVGIVVRKKTKNTPNSGEVKKVEPSKEIIHKEMLGSGILADKQIEVYSTPVDVAGSLEGNDTLKSGNAPDVSQIESGEVIEAPADSLIGPDLDPSVDLRNTITVTNGEGTLTISSDSEKPVYTEEFLSEMSRKQLRDVAASLGIDASTVQRKEDIKNMILGKK